MKKIVSIQCGEWAFNFAMFCLRLVAGLTMLLAHGLDKLQKFNTLQGNFYSFLGLGSRTSLVLAIFAELFCGLFIILGLFTRLTVLPLIITMLVAIFGHNAGRPWIESETGGLYLVIYFAILLCGPGKISIDGMMAK